MPEFQITHGSDEALVAWKALDPFVAGYLACALWLLDEEIQEKLGEGPYATASDYLSAEAFESAADDCKEFLDTADAVLALAYATGSYDESQAGHDFFLTRNHHGVGFWDRGLGAVGDALTKLAHSYGSADLYLGDDEKLYFM